MVSFTTNKVTTTATSTTTENIATTAQPTTKPRPTQTTDSVYYTTASASKISTPTTSSSDQVCLYIFCNETDQP